MMYKLGTYCQTYKMGDYLSGGGATVPRDNGSWHWTIASAIESVGAAAFGPRIDDSFLLGHLRWLGGLLLAALEQPGRRDAGRIAAAAWRPWVDGSDGRCGRLT